MSNMSNGQEKYWVINKYKKGDMLTIISNPANDIQFLRVLKILILEKASLNNCRVVGTTSSPFSVSQPYEGF